ncbi:MAG: lytic murein transglycosylase, partial [Deltaproteobacteria bacterium]|jgi:membrane-bound lytic murein transglycosylase B|nr:lytic murein transglycosylase [Deltaproteobacteria bacterium]
LAGELVRDGLPEGRVRRFFSSPGLEYNPLPMETKLRELFGIYFDSDLTREVQEKLFRLGREILIDGKNGPGTGRAILAFEKERNLPANGKVTRNLLAALDKALKTETSRPLSEYKPPVPAKPSRTATHGRFTNESAIKTISGLYLADKKIFDRMEAIHGVPGPVVASVMWIETGYGNYFGKNKAAVMLASMAASADYSLVAPRLRDLEENEGAGAYLSETALKRGAWARDELEALLVYAWENGLDPMDFPGSVYGAVGYGQFMPSNIKKHAVDGDGDRKIDLFDKTDAVHSIGNYLRNHGWRGDMSDEEKRREVIRRYNNSGVYVNTVLYVADRVAAGTGER